MELPALLPYRVRISRRARQPSVAVCLHEGIVVTVPLNYDQRRIPALLRQWQPWLEKQIRKADAARCSLPPELLAPLPDRIVLPAIDQCWRLSYRGRGQSHQVRLREHNETLQLSADAHGDTEACRAALRRWLARKARASFAPQLAALAARHGLHYARLSIRGQRSRWGSYSSTGTLSLNYLLLFLEPELVRCVMLHELCHSRYMSHGPRFQALLRRLEPDCVALDARINTAWQRVPRWAWRT